MFHPFPCERDIFNYCLLLIFDFMNLISFTSNIITNIAIIGSINIAMNPPNTDTNANKTANIIIINTHNVTII